ncbi:METTL5 family protein [Halobaculum sp. MBLA0147]|uniref:METTL5 family protein n=1 Tax=Halobaculum sp. MBLA0147 TaxID=3079934 RepID=UPI0035253E91
MQKRAVERALADVASFADPEASLEQYPTPTDVAAHLCHVAAMRGDVADALVVDLGAGTGRLALAAALYEPAAVVGVEFDADALATARRNERRVDPPTPVWWLRADASRSPLCLGGLDGLEDLGDLGDLDGLEDLGERQSDTTDDEEATTPARVTVVANPPFGAQTGNEHADRAFLETVAATAGECSLPVVSYTLHNEGSASFVESFVEDAGGRVTDAFAVTLDLNAQFAHHTADRVQIQTELFRVAWTD